MTLHNRGTWITVALVCVVGLASGAVLTNHGLKPKSKPRSVPLTRAEQARQVLFAELQPVKLANCELERFGERNDGGYLLCANLLGEVKSAYSYGISGYDQWGCDVSTRLDVRVHEYDCFDHTRPRCSTGNAVFHDECIGDSRRMEGQRPFDTLENQVVKNGDAGKRLVVKMDVEGAEWESFLGASDDVLRRIDQVAIEFHGFDEERFILAIWKLKQFFYVVNLHWNNFSCGGQPPFPSWAYEALLVNKRIAVLDPAAKVAATPLNRPNNPALSDCQAATGTVPQSSR